MPPEENKSENSIPEANTPANNPPVVESPDKQPLLVVKPSDVKIDDNLIKKRGFLLTLSKDPSSEILLQTEITAIKEKYNAILTEFSKHQLSREEHMLTELGLFETHHTALLEKRTAYSQYLDNLKSELQELNMELGVLHQKVAETLKELGKAKESVVKRSLEEMKSELEQAMQINEDLQNTQNEELEKRYRRDEDSFKAKIDFWKIILNNHQEHYQQVSERLKLLSRDGINAQVAQFLIYLGGVSALVSGWWFSLWAGPQSGLKNTDNVAGNTSVRFFFLDNIGKFLGSYSLGMMALIVVCYIVGVGVVSWYCHRLLVRYGFIIDIRELRKKRNKTDAEEQDSYEFDVEEQERLLKAKVKSTAWWGLWLKITPIILALVPILGVISRELSTDGTGSFQGLFDSLVNEFIGTSIAIMFSIFCILLLTRVSENKYFKRNQQNKDEPDVGFNIQYIGFIFFALMILGMILYHYPILIFDDIRRVATFGFVVSCLATGFSLGYGYVFDGLKNNSDMLLFYIDTITSIIHYLSKPSQVNYTTNWSLKARIYKLQQKMFNLIEGRALLATDIAYGIETPNAKRSMLVVREREEETAANVTNESSNGKVVNEKKENVSKKEKKAKNKNTQENQTPRPRLLRRIINLVVPNKYKKNNSSSDEYLDELTVSHNDLIYFPEVASKLKELHHRMQELRDRISHIRTEEENRWRNLGIWHSIGDQIIYNRIKKDKLNAKLIAFGQECLNETMRITAMEKRETTLLTEGYYTGLWFKDIDPSIPPPNNHFDVDTKNPLNNAPNNNPNNNTDNITPNLIS